MSPLQLLETKLKQQIDGFSRRRDSNRRQYQAFFWAQIVSMFVAALAAGLNFIREISPYTHVVTIVATTVTGTVATILSNAAYRERWEHYTNTLNKLYKIRDGIEFAIAEYGEDRVPDAFVTAQHNAFQDTIDEVNQNWSKIMRHSAGKQF